MMDELVLSARVINFEAISNRELLALLQQNTAGVEFYEPKFEPGVIYASAGFWKMAGKIEPVISIFAAIMGLYATQIQPNSPPDSDAGIVVRIENAGSHNTFHIGGDIKTEEELIKRLQDSLTLLKTQLELERTKAELNALRNSPHWRRVN